MSVLLICNHDPSWGMSGLWLQINFLSSKPRAANNNHLAGRCMVCQWAFLPVLPFESTTNNNVRKKRLWLWPIMRPVGCTGKISERLLETAFVGQNHYSVHCNSSGVHPCSQRGNCTLNHATDWDRTQIYTDLWIRFERNGTFFHR